MMQSTLPPPASARQFKAAVNVGPSDNEDVVPIELVARSPEPIEHASWGRVVHDLNGFYLPKDPAPIDYGHGEEVGLFYARNVSVDADRGLVIKGVLVRTKAASDPLEKLLARRRAGVPFEASIDFTGEPPTVERAPAGRRVTVNGREFSGPLTVIRKWPLRGVAIVKAGADHNTAAQFSAATAEPVPCPAGLQFKFPDDAGVPEPTVEGLRFSFPGDAARELGAKGPDELDKDDPGYPHGVGSPATVIGSGRKRAAKRKKKPQIDFDFDRGNVRPLK